MGISFCIYTFFFHLHPLIQKHNYQYKNGLGVVHFPQCHILAKKSICHELWSDTYIRNLSLRTVNSTYLENFTLKRTTCLHKILIKTGKNGMDIFKMLKVAFEEQIVGRTLVLVAFQVQKMYELCWRCQIQVFAHQQVKQMKLLTECRTAFGNRSIHEVAYKLGISFGLLQNIFKDSLNMYQTTDKLVAHTCSFWFVCALTTKKKLLFFPAPPYSSDSVLCNFLLFPELKAALQGSIYNYHQESSKIRTYLLHYK